jgi:DNA-binding NtrC family response regulator
MQLKGGDVRPCHHPLIENPPRRAERPRSGVPEAETILVAASDRVLADSLRFSLELEGYDAKLCDERSLLPALAEQTPRLLVLDQDVFLRLDGRDGAASLRHIGIPVVLMVGQKTQRLMERAKAAGVSQVVEKPLLGGVLFDAIRNTLDGHVQRQ